MTYCIVRIWSSSLYLDSFFRGVRLVVIARGPLPFAVWSTAVCPFKLVPYPITLCFSVLDSFDKDVIVK